MKYRVAKSKIHGDGIFATQPIAKGEYISDTPDYIDNVNQTIASSFHNHDEKNPNVLNVEKGKQRFLIAKRGIEVGEELTTDYNLTPSPPFEDPNDFKDLDERELPLSDEEAQEMLNAGFVLEEMHEGGSPHKHPHEDEVTITGSRRKDPSNLSLEQRQQAYDDSVVLYNSGRRNKHFAENLAMFIEGADNSHINYVKSHFDDNIAKEKAFAKEAHDRLMRLNRFIKGDLHEEKAPTTGDLYETIRWEEYSDYKPKGKRPKSSFDLNDPYEFGLHVNERLGKAFDEMTKQDMVGDEMYGDIDNYSSFYRNNYKARSDKYDLQGNNYNFASGVRDYDEEQLKSYIDLYKEFIDGYQNAIDKGEEKDYTKRYLKSYKDIVSTLEEVLDSPIKPKSVIYNPELAPIYIYDKPTYKQAYKNVDKDKYPTYEDFEFAADYYNETGTNPDFQDLPSNRLAPPPEPEYEVNDIEPEIEIDRLPIVKSKLNLDASLPEELEGVDYVLDKKGNISGFIKADPGKTGNRKRNYRKLKRGKKERALDDLNEGLQYKHGGSHELPKAQDGIAGLIKFQKDLNNPKTIESGRKLVYGEPGFKEQQESINKDRATIITDLVPKIPTSIQELETLVDESIGSPQKKARVLAAKRTEEGEDEQDNYRHASAGRLTAEAIQNKTGNIPYLSAGAGWLGSNILGIGHELSTLFSDDRPWLTKATEAAEDIYNNNAGASTILNSLSPKENDDILFHKSINYILPDGYGEKRPFKDNQGWTDPYNNKEEDGGPINTSGPLPEEYLKSQGFADATNQDLDSLLRGFNTDGYDSHWYQGKVEDYGVTADQLRGFATENRPKGFVNAAAYAQAMNKLSNEAGGTNVSNIPFAQNAMVMRTDADDLPVKEEYVAPQTLQEQGYINETGTNAVNQDQSYSTGLAKRYGRGMYDHLVEEQDGGIIELTDKEADKYRADGYVLEEMHEGGPSHPHPHGDDDLEKRKAEMRAYYKKSAPFMSDAQIEMIVSKLDKEETSTSAGDALYSGKGKQPVFGGPTNLKDGNLKSDFELRDKSASEIGIGDGSTAKKAATEFVDFAGNTIADFTYRPIKRTAKKVWNDPINFVSDLATTASDIQLLPLRLSKEIYDYGFGDGNFEWRKLADMDALGTSADALSSFPAFKGASSILKPLRREFVYRAVNPVGYEIGTKIKNMPKELYKNITNPKGRPGRVFDDEGGRSTFSNLAEREAAGKRRLDAWRIYLGKDQKYNTFRKNFDGTYTMNDEFMINPRLKSAKSSYGKARIQNDIAVDAQLYRIEEMLKSGKITKAEAQVMREKAYDLRSYNPDSALPGHNEMIDMLSLTKPSNTKLKMPSKIQAEQQRIVKPSTDSNFDYDVFDIDPFGVRGGYKFKIKLPESSPFNPKVSTSRSPSSYVSTSKSPSNPKSLKDLPDSKTNYIIESEDVWDLMPFERSNSKPTFLFHNVDKTPNSMFQNLEIGKFIGGKPFNITKKQTFDLNLNKAPNDFFEKAPALKLRKQGGGAIEATLTKKNHGGEDNIISPDGDPYEYKKVGDKYYTRLKEGEYNREYAEGEEPVWDLATGEAEAAIKYKVFKEQKPEPVVEDPFYTYDPNNPKNFEARYNNEFKLDQSQDGLKPQYFAASNLPLVGLDGTDPDAEYNAYVAAKPQYKRTPSWIDKNVFEPVDDLYDKFKKTDLGPIGDMANFAIVEPAKMVANLAEDIIKDPNEVAGETMQMMVDGVMFLPRMAAEGIYTDFINPDAEWDWSNIGSAKSLERGAQYATIAPFFPSIVGTGGKTVVRNTGNIVDDIVPVAAKTDDVVPTAAVTTSAAAPKVVTSKQISSTKPSVQNQVRGQVQKVDGNVADKTTTLTYKSFDDNGKITNLAKDKTGKINTEQALKILDNESSGTFKSTAVTEAVKKKYNGQIPKKIDPQELQTLADETIPIWNVEVRSANQHGIGQQRPKPQYGIHRLDYDNSPLPYEPLVPYVNQGYKFADDPIAKSLREKSKEMGYLESEIRLNLKYIENAKADLQNPLKSKMIAESERELSLAELSLAENQAKLKTMQSEYYKILDDQGRNYNLENNALVFKSDDLYKKGFAGSDHTSLPNTVAHVHYVVRSNSPKTFTVTQFQSDAFQSGVDATRKFKESGIQHAKNELQQYANYKNAKKLDVEWSPLEYYQAKDAINGTDIARPKKWFDDQIANYERKRVFANTNNKEQTILDLYQGKVDEANIVLNNLDEYKIYNQNWESRTLQETVDYAAKNGQTTFRFPTGETNVKVQGYNKRVTEALNDKSKMKDFVGNDLRDYNISQRYEKTYPRLVEKTYGVKPKKVTDVEGNTWWQFDIPEKVMEGTKAIIPYKQGGSVEANLSPADVQRYIDEGYILEEIN